MHSFTLVYRNRTTTHPTHLRKLSYIHHNSLPHIQAAVYFYIVKTKTIISKNL